MFEEHSFKRACIQVLAHFTSWVALNKFLSLHFLIHKIGQYLSHRVIRSINEIMPKAINVVSDTKYTLHNIMLTIVLYLAQGLPSAMMITIQNSRCV